MCPASNTRLAFSSWPRMSISCTWADYGTETTGIAWQGQAETLTTPHAAQWHAREGSFSSEICLPGTCRDWHWHAE